MALLPLADAISRFLGAARPVMGAETVSLAEADGRVLAGDVAARLTQPPFDASAMDGYALAGDDAPAIGSELTVVGMAAAGHAFDGRIGKGQAVRIFTGAPVPEGADSILIQEDVEALEGNRIRTLFELKRGRHIRPRGQDFRQGEVLIAAGTRLDFSHLTLAAAGNHPVLQVYRRVRVAILSTGDELVPPGTSPAPDQIIASNAYGLSALVRDNGGAVIDLGILRDSAAEIRAAIGRAREQGADLLVTLGGASVGDHDLVQKSLKAEGMELNFWRIAMRPGKPLMVGRLGDMQVIGLPGNPVASMVTGLVFVEPLLRLLGHLPERRREVDAVAAKALLPNDHRQDFLRARLYRDEGGRLVAEPFEKQDSSMMKIFAMSDGLVIRPAHAPELPAGAPCRVLLIRGLD